MRAYIAVNLKMRPALNDEIRCVIKTLNRFQIDPYVFVDNNFFEQHQEKQMMSKAMHEIDMSDLVIAETSFKGIGVGVEAGYAKGKSKPVVYLRKIESEHSTTVAGISDHSIIYGSLQDLEQKLALVLKSVLRS